VSNVLGYVVMIDFNGFPWYLTVDHSRGTSLVASLRGATIWQSIEDIDEAKKDFRETTDMDVDRWVILPLGVVQTEKTNRPIFHLD
jgi:hypothetical protein